MSEAEKKKMTTTEQEASSTPEVDENGNIIVNESLKKVILCCEAGIIISCLLQTFDLWDNADVFYLALGVIVMALEAKIRWKIRRKTAIVLLVGGVLCLACFVFSVVRLLF